METNTNRQPGVTDTAVNEKTGNTGGRNRRRSAISAEATHILRFLCKCAPYEADAVRVMASHATGSGKVEDIPATDILAVNRFLNFGMNKSNTPDADAVLAHRQKNAETLLQSVRRFCDPEALCRATVALMRITIDRSSVHNAFGNLPDNGSAKP